MTTAALVITRDAQLSGAVEAAAAAASVLPLTTGEAGQIRRHWHEANLVLVGADLASLVIGLALPVRDGVHLIGTDTSQLIAWSVPLGAPTLLLPQQSGFLTSLLDRCDVAAAPSASSLRVVGGSGGVGATTLAAALAQRAAACGQRSALVELDRFGGGVDLLFGAEDEPGWRWADLSSAAGHVGDLGGQLPNVSGVDLVSLGHLDAASTLPALDAIRAVVGSLQRSHDVVIMDAGCASDGLLSVSARTLVVVAAQVRAVLSARCRIAELGLQDAELVVRTGPGWKVDPDLIAQTIGMPVAALIPHDGSWQSGAATGDPPGRSSRSKTGRACNQLLDSLLGLQVTR